MKANRSTECAYPSPFSGGEGGEGGPKVPKWQLTVRIHKELYALYSCTWCSTRDISHLMDNLEDHECATEALHISPRQSKYQEMMKSWQGPILREGRH